MNFHIFKLHHQLILDCEFVESAMYYSCKNGDFSLCKLIAKNFPNINIHHRVSGAEPDFIFRVTCSNNHFDIAKWLKNTWPNINHTLAYHGATRYCLNNYTESKKPLIKWLIQLYDIDSVCGLINALFESSMLYYNNYIIKYFDISELQIDTKYQLSFDIMIDQYQKNKYRVKSARK